MHENIITWNVTNWITIVLMAFLGFAILAVIASMRNGFAGSAAGA